MIRIISVETFKPHYQHACSPYCSPYISYGTSWENLLTHQDTSSLVIIALILMTCMFDQVNDTVRRNYIDACHYWGLKG